MKFVDIQRAQQFEYHYAHLIDKPFESWYNFIHVLPGAFSGYRMKAIKKEDDEH
jgi:chitin synthase